MHRVRIQNFVYTLGLILLAVAPSASAQQSTTGAPPAPQCRRDDSPLNIEGGSMVGDDGCIDAVFEITVGFGAQCDAGVDFNTRNQVDQHMKRRCEFNEGVVQGLNFGAVLCMGVCSRTPITSDVVDPERECVYRGPSATWICSPGERLHYWLRGDILCNCELA